MPTPLIIDVSREYREGEKIRLIKMLGSEDVGMFTKHGLIQLDFPTLVEAVYTMIREEEYEIKNREKIFSKQSFLSSV